VNLARCEPALERYPERFRIGVFTSEFGFRDARDSTRPNAGRFRAKEAFPRRWDPARGANGWTEIDVFDTSGLATIRVTGRARRYFGQESPSASRTCPYLRQSWQSKSPSAPESETC